MGRLENGAALGAEAAAAFLRERVPDVVTWDGWERIDAHEVTAGDPHGRPRVKLVRHEHFADVVGAGSSGNGAPS